MNAEDTPPRPGAHDPLAETWQSVDQIVSGPPTPGPSPATESRPAPPAPDPYPQPYDAAAGQHPLAPSAPVQHPPAPPAPTQVAPMPEAPPQSYSAAAVQHMPAPPAPVQHPPAPPAPTQDVPTPAPPHDVPPPPAPPQATPTPEPPAAAAPPDPPDAPEAPDAGIPGLGDPWHSGSKPPLYPAEPRAVPRVRVDPSAALIPDMVVDGAAHEALTVRAASVRGDSHRYHAEPRQDSLAVTRIGEQGADELLLLAVADGVGSAARSHVGSQQACRLAALYLDTVAAELATALREADPARFAGAADPALRHVATLLAHQARERGEDPGAYSTTLRMLLVPLDPAVRVRGFLAVGDGGTALLRDGRWYLGITDPDPHGDGEGAGVIDTRTAALPHSHRAQVQLIGPAQPGDVLVLCTDGLSTPLAGDAGMRDFLARSWGSGPVPAPADFLWQFQYRVKSYDDDRTAVVLWETAETPS
ncbi:protein phosphatase 2C domain-containing protein [Streptomyces sp. NPDC052610]|uniref:PP2C family serine/threonine-protein phosphatase n=1 Tax=Streptomyces sp. NPDC052610 TaxID=3154952 RepID=UPI003413EC53